MNFKQSVSVFPVLAQAALNAYVPHDCKTDNVPPIPNYKSVISPIRTHIDPGILPKKYDDIKFLIKEERFVIIYKEDGTNNYTIAFKGTNFEEIYDFLIDVVFIPAEFKPYCKKIYKEKKMDECKVHAGFQFCYLFLRKQIFNFLEGKQIDQLNITGHSLGGAVAHLFFFDALCSKLMPKSTDKKITVTLTTFGCPRVGGHKLNQNIKKLYDHSPDNIALSYTRFESKWDPVTVLPPKGDHFIHWAIGTATTIPDANSFNPHSMQFNYKYYIDKHYGKITQISGRIELISNLGYSSYICSDGEVKSNSWRKAFSGTKNYISGSASYRGGNILLIIPLKSDPHKCRIATIFGEPGYLCVDGKVKKNSFSWAFFGAENYVQKNYKGGDIFTIERAGNKQFRVKASYGESESYLCVNGGVKEDSWKRVFFGTTKYMNDPKYKGGDLFTINDANYNIIEGKHAETSRLCAEKFEPKRYSRGFFGTKRYIAKGGLFSGYSGLEIIQFVYIGENKVKIKAVFGGKETYLFVNGKVKSNSWEKAYFGAETYISGHEYFGADVFTLVRDENGAIKIKSNFGRESFLCIEGKVGEGSYSWAFFGTESYINSSSKYRGGEVFEINRFLGYSTLDEPIETTIAKMRAHTES